MRASWAWSLSALAGLALAAGCAASSRDRPPFYVLFGERRQDSGLEVTYTAADIRSERGGACLTLDSPGRSTLTLTFSLPHKPERLYVLFDWRADAGPALYTLSVNGDRVDQRLFEWDEYMTLGVDIAQRCEGGRNTVEISLAPESARLSVRGAMISDTPSLLDNARQIREKQVWSARRLLPVFVGVGLVLLIPLAVSIFRRAFGGAMAPIPYRASLAAFSFGALSAAYAWFCVRALFWHSVALVGGILLLILISMSATRRARPGCY